MPGTLLAFLQFFFTLTWVVYVIYLPALAEQAGLERRHVGMILMMDQVIFLACDWAAGVYADRIAKAFGKIGETMAYATLVSCASFIALPWVAPHAGAPVFLFVTILWSVTSSALRAPPFAIVSRHASESGRRWVPGAYLFGLGVASAIAPFLSVELKKIDPRLVFASASIALALFALALARAERRFSPAAASEPRVPAAGASAASMTLFAVVVLLFAIGFQVHFALNSAPRYLAFTTLDDLSHLMPVFWVGFNLAVFPAGLLARRHGGAAILVAAGVIGVAALLGCARAPSLNFLLVAQSIAGLAWGTALTAAFTAALDLGRPGREGFLTGVLFSVLAAAALARMGVIATGLQGTPRIAHLLENLPFIAWALAAFVMAAIAFPARTTPKTPT